LPKKAIIEAQLVDDAEKISDKKLESDINDFLNKLPPKIPWVKTIKKVNVT
jgi:hypothetical protein